MFETKQQERDRLESEINNHEILKYDYSIYRDSDSYKTMMLDLESLLFDFVLNYFSNHGAAYARAHQHEETEAGRMQRSFLDQMGNLWYKKGNDEIYVINEAMETVLQYYNPNAGVFVQLFLYWLKKMKAFAKATESFETGKQGVVIYKNENERNIAKKLLRQFREYQESPEEDGESGAESSIVEYYDEKAIERFIKENPKTTEEQVRDLIDRIYHMAYVDSLDRESENNEGSSVTLLDRYGDETYAPGPELQIDKEEFDEGFVISSLGRINDVFLHSGSQPTKLIRSLYTTSICAITIYEEGVEEYAKKLEFFNQEAYDTVLKRYKELIDRIPARCDDVEAYIEEKSIKKRAQLKLSEITEMCNRLTGPEGKKKTLQNTSKVIKKYQDDLKKIL